MKVAYIAGPYRASTIFGIQENIRKAEYFALKYWKRGYAVICPHKNTALLDGAAPDEVWLQGGLELLKRSNVIVLIPGWRDSEGSIAEYDFARKHNIKILMESWGQTREESM